MRSGDAARAPIVKILLSWSSGKDSAWTLQVLNRTNPGEVAALLTTVNEDLDRVATHGVRRTVLEAQASALGLPLRLVPIPDPCSNDAYEKRLRTALDAAAAAGFTHMAFGDLYLEDVRRYREHLLTGSPLQPLFPIWGIPTTQLAEDMIAAGLRARVSCVDTRVLDAGFAGREFDRALLRDLPSGIDPCGENGEFHTCAYAGPMFATPLNLDACGREQRDPFVWADLTLSSTARFTVAQRPMADGQWPILNGEIG